MCSAAGVQCRSLQCSDLFQCAGFDGVADSIGCTCAYDDDCRSGYCNVASMCDVKIANGDTSCQENDDCLSSYCGMKSSHLFECKASKGGDQAPTHSCTLGED